MGRERANHAHVTARAVFSLTIMCRPPWPQGGGLIERRLCQHHGERQQRRHRRQRGKFPTCGVRWPGTYLLHWHTYAGLKDLSRVIRMEEKMELHLTQIMTVLFRFPILTHLRGICPFSPQKTLISSRRPSGHLERSTDDVTPVRALPPAAPATPAHDLGVKKLRIIWRGVRTVPKWRETPRQSIEWGRRVAGVKRKLPKLKFMLKKSSK